MDKAETEKAWRRMYALAYRMVGRHAEAQDIVQESFARFHARKSLDEVEVPGAYLAKIATRLALNSLRSKSRSPIDYIGFDLPEPVAMADYSATAADDLLYGMTVVLQSLSPAERAAYLLRTMFDLDYSEISAVIGRREGACRQLVSRAHVALGKAGQSDVRATPVDTQLLRRLVEAVRDGNLHNAIACLADTATLSSNATKGQPALLQALQGQAAVARFAISSRQWLPPDSDWRVGIASGTPIAVALLNKVPVFALLAESRNGFVQNLYAISDRDKLRNLNVSGWEVAH